VTRREPPAASALPRAAWRTTILVRFAHCDPAGIVYYARFFDMMNGVIEDWFAQNLGLDYHAFIGPRRVGLGYAKADADFFATATMGDRLTFAVLVDRIGGASVALDLHAHRGADPILSARLVIVTTSLVEHRSIPLPDDFREALETYRESCR
jgi:4-hydroxybenzoyl-CoA thioesterase